MHEMSAPHFSSGPAAVKSWSSRSGATGPAWRLPVVRLNRRFCRALRPFSRIRRAVRRRLTERPLSRGSRVIRGLPQVPLDSANADRTCASSTMSSRWRRQAGRPFQAE